MESKDNEKNKLPPILTWIMYLSIVVGLYCGGFVFYIEYKYSKDIKSISEESKAHAFMAEPYRLCRNGITSTHASCSGSIAAGAKANGFNEDDIRKVILDLGALNKN